MILDGKDGDVETRGVALTDPGEVGTSNEVTSMHGSRDDLVLGERVNGKSGVLFLKKIK